MAALPEVYRYNILDEGVAPDVTALEQALPAYGSELITDDMYALSDQILEISEALPRAGLQGTFGYVYGSLTRVIADGIHHPSKRNLPKFENPDDLQRQAGHFADTWIAPLRGYVEYIRSDDDEAKQAAMEKIGPHWDYAFFTPEVQTARPVVQFVAGGMAEHIIGGTDLAESLVRSQVSAKYMAPGGDYRKIDAYIRYVTLEKAPELVDGNAALVRLGVQPVPVTIAGMRHLLAKRNYFRLLQAGSQAGHDRILEQANEDAVRVSSLFVRFGNVALDAFDLATGGSGWRRFRRRQQDQVDGTQEEAA